jgi:membrane protein DedA with SNARE-associated domain
MLFFVALSGDFIGDALHYIFGRWFYKHIIFRYEKRFKKMGEAVEKAIEYLRENPGKTILFGKWTHVANFPILIAAGAAKISLTKFFGYCMLGTTPKIMILILIGYAFGSAYEQIDIYMGKISSFLFIFVGIIVIFLYGNWLKK